MPGIDPIQQFIQTHMAVQQHNMQQQQLGAQQALQKQQLQQQSIGQFATLMGATKNDQERAAVGEAFSQSNPELAGVFQALTRAIGSTAQTQTAAAMETRGVGELVKEQRIAGGLEASIGQQIQDRQFGEQLANRKFEFNTEFMENQRQFGISAAQRERGLDQADRGLNIQAAQVSQQGALGQLDVMQRAGLTPLQLQSTLSVRVRNLAKELSSMPETDPRRIDVAQELADTRRSMETLGTVMTAQMTPRGSGGGLNVDDLPGMIETQRKLLNDLQNAKTPAERTGLKQNYDAVTQLINSVAPQLQAQPVGDTRSYVQRWIEGFFKGDK